MTTQSATMPFPARLRTELKLDPVLLLIATSLLLGGFVVLASASITVSDNVAGEPFYGQDRFDQLLWRPWCSCPVSAMRSTVPRVGCESA